MTELSAAYEGNLRRRKLLTIDGGGKTRPAIKETIRLMSEIDKAIPKWPME